MTVSSFHNKLDNVRLTTEKDGLSNNLTNWTFDPNVNHDQFQDLHYHYSMPVKCVMCGIILIVIILAVVGNTMVILTIIRHKGMRTRTNMFLVNLAVADILVAILAMPISLVTILKGYWVFGDYFCQINGFSMAMLLICSIHTLMYIGIHKYISIIRPFSRTMTPRKILLMIAAAWIWSIVCAMSPLLGWNSIVYKRGASQCGPSLPTNWLQYSHSVFITTTDYIIPLAVMCYCYFHIFKEINQHMIRIRETSNVDLTNSVSQQKRINVTLLLVLACFLLCWTPFIVYSTTISILKDKSKMPLIVNPVAYWCGYLNSACNPIIYALRSPSFRRGYREIMCEYIPHDKGNIQAGRLQKICGSTKAFSAPCSPSGSKKFLRDQDRGYRPKQFRNRVLLSQTSWASLPFLSAQSTHHRDIVHLAHDTSNSPLLDKYQSPSHRPIGDQLVSLHPQPYEKTNGQRRNVLDNNSNRDGQNSSELSILTDISNDSSKSAIRKYSRSLYRPKTTKMSASSLIRSASVDSLDTSLKLDSGVWTSKISIRWKANRKKKKMIENGYKKTPKEELIYNKSETIL